MIFRWSGIRYASVVPGKDILPRYQHQVEQVLPLALSQGRLGWQATDLQITLIGHCYIGKDGQNGRRLESEGVREE